MNNFTRGLLAGSLIGALGLTLATGEKKARKHIIRNGKSMLDEAGNIMDDIKHRIW